MQAAIDKWLDSAAAIEAGLEFWIEPGCQHASDEVGSWQEKLVVPSTSQLPLASRSVSVVPNSPQLSFCCTQDRAKGKSSIEEQLKLVEQQLSAQQYLVSAAGNVLEL